MRHHAPGSALPFFVWPRNCGQKPELRILLRQRQELVSVKKSLRIARSKQQSHFRLGAGQVMEEHGPERGNTRARCYKHNAVTRMAKREIAERLLNVNRVARLQGEQIRRDHAILNPVQAQSKTVAVVRRSNGVSACNLLAFNLFDNRNKLARREGKRLHFRHFKLKMVNFRREFPLSEQSSLQHPSYRMMLG